MKIVEISCDNVARMSDYAEKMLRYGGKLMSCLEEIDMKYGERHRVGRREPEMDDDDEYRYGSRKYGRYM